MPFLTQGKTNWKFLFVVVFLAIMAGGISWNYYQMVVKEEIEPPKIEIFEKRILIDQEKWDEQIYAPIDLGQEFNTDPSAEKFLYSNQTRGVSLYFPYNPKWGTEKYKIMPYYKASCPSEETEIGAIGVACNDGISFAPLVFFETLAYPSYHFVSYMNRMYFLPARSIEEIVDSLHYFEGGKGRDEIGVLEETVTIDKINNIPIVKYVVASYRAGDQPMIEVTGKKYNYLFTCLDLDCGEEEQKVSEEVISSIKFID